MNHTVAYIVPTAKDLFWTTYGASASLAATVVSKSGLPYDWSIKLVNSTNYILVFGIVGVLYIELIYQWTKFLYRRGWIQRHQLALPDDRDYVMNYFAATSIVTMPVFYIAARWEIVYPKITYKFDFWQLVLFQLAVFFLQDIWYFYGHRYMHKNKVLWNWVHSHHHEKRNINAFSTGYAAWIENFLLIGPSILISVVLMDLMPSFNMLTLRLAWLSQFKIFVIGHTGMKMHPLLYFGNPFAWLQQVLSPVGLSQIPEDHEMHHLYPMCNFSLNFRLWDTLWGSYKSIETLNRNKKKA
ncbi:hypothetical protein SpCBS45565_g03391 [Spizellomyces sp. 'palustris']|nr:hypothetical protein SpCBS45565_g03391 [Spizellomyces sp. 'palustris']